MYVEAPPKTAAAPSYDSESERTDRMRFLLDLALALRSGSITREQHDAILKA
jgi:hypothetical protein